MQDKQEYPASDDTRLAARAQAQHGVVSRAQLLEDGYSRSGIQTRLHAGRLHPIHRGVYAVGHTLLTERGRWMAAVLACGRDAALSHHEAAVLHGLLRTGPGAINVTAPTRHQLDGIRCHLAGEAAEPTVTVDGIPATNLERTLLDIAGTRRFDTAFRQAQHQDMLDRRRLDALVARHPGHRGMATLRSASPTSPTSPDGPSPSWSDASSRSPGPTGCQDP